MMIWIDQPRQADTYVAFRGGLAIPVAGVVELRILAASWYNLWLDGKLIHEGPPRFHIRHPQYEILNLPLDAGRHVLSAVVHDVGSSTRMLAETPPFLYCVARVNGVDVPIDWRCRQLEGYRPRVRRINPQLGWMEWCDTRKIPRDWQAPQFDDSDWNEPVPANPGIGEMMPADLGLIQQIPHALRPIAHGTLVERFAYELDDPSARFLLRDLHPADLPPQGIWRRYDVGHVRLGRAAFTMDVPAGAVVEFAYAESLTDGRVTPYITASLGTSANMDHYTARGGVQEFRPITPRGGRFIEVHVLCDPADVKFISERYIERTYHADPIGSIDTGDELLNRVWTAGLETYRSCAEDAIIDNPTRERGQWTGDVIVGMEVAAAAYGDLRLVRRALVQTAQCARDDGMVAGLSPGHMLYIPWYAVQWTMDCVRYVELSGDRSLLDELFEAARANMKALAVALANVPRPDPLSFIIDWGFVPTTESIQNVYGLMHLMAARAMQRWCAILDRCDEQQSFATQERLLRDAILTRIDATLSRGGWDELGYHATSLALSLDLVPADRAPATIESIKRHLMQCFPNNPAGPRFSEPGFSHRHLMTPYFAHFSFPPLIERGEMPFVLDQFRRCWGWAIDQGRTTLLEVFDPRWSHCHQWSACPTWQLTRYLLGLHPRFDLEPNCFALRLEPGNVRSATGGSPLSGANELISINWQRRDDIIRYTLRTPRPIVLLYNGNRINVTDTITLQLRQS